MKSNIKKILMATERKGIKSLLKEMECNGFYTAPCSSQYHLCKVGGLAEHSLNVYKTMMDLSNTLIGKLPTCSEVSIVALLHDIGKASYRNKPNYVENILKSGKVSDVKPFETNKERLTIPHEIVSLQIISKHIELTEEEEFAILYHNGLYVPSGRDIQGKERPLQQLLHFSDMWCSRFIESKAE